ncbi:MAG: sigma-70 family RNA polymerase sigma factor [Clostridium sp.]
MDYHRVEILVSKAKKGDELAKGSLINAFKPLIIKQISNFKIVSYDFDDLLNECNYILVKLINSYTLGDNSFSAFFKVGIRNHLLNLLKKNNICDVEVKSYDGVEEIVCEDTTVSDGIFNWELREDIRMSLEDLASEERELLTFVYLKGNSLKDFSIRKNIPYSTARHRRDMSISRFKRILLKNRMSFIY